MENLKITRENYGMYLAIKRLNELERYIDMQLNEHPRTNTAAGATKKLCIKQHAQVLKNSLKELMR